MRCEVRFMHADGEVREVHDWLDDPSWTGPRALSSAEPING
jgi:hypothetical protein